MARVLSMNCITLASSNVQYKGEMLDLRADRNFKRILQTSSEPIPIEYDLTLKNITSDVLKGTKN